MDKAATTEEWDFSVFSVIRHKNHQGQAFHALRCPDWVNVIAITANEQFVLVNQHRFGTQMESLEFPGGIVDIGSSPLFCAINELREETGFSSNDWNYLGSYRANPGLQNNYVHSFICKNALQGNSEIEAGMHTVLLNAEDLISAIYDHEGPLRQAFALASFHLAIQQGHIKIPNNYKGEPQQL